MTAQQFVRKWSKIQLKERTTAQTHFNDICALVGHKAPLEEDPKGEYFTFEADAEKPEGERGWADAYYRGKFIWEYKGPHHSLDAAYQQLLLYKDSLGNPPLLITSDTQEIRIHTNFTNTVKKVYAITFDDLLSGQGVDLLHRAFYDPESLKPAETPEQITNASAKQFVEVANALQKYEEKKLDPERLAHFIIRLLFCLFAEDIGLLPDKVFSNLVKQNLPTEKFRQSLKTLFATMKTGGMFGFTPIPFFNGGLFDDDFVPNELPDIAPSLRDVSGQDWSSIDPSIFGTLFERIIDESKRAQLGAHYTSKEDILLVIEPVLMQPLRDQWQNVKLQAENKTHDEAYKLLQEFSKEVAATRVLDPACGSGNFLCLALRQLLDLQKEIITLAVRLKLPDLPLTVGPQQVYGIEINPYAHELAQITVWIGYLQWRSENGFAKMDEPILKPLHQIENKDAIIDLKTGKEPTWPNVDVIISNPPFLGSQKMRTELGDKYVDDLRNLYGDRIPGASDLVCYWFENARAMIESQKVKRVGLLATNSIRGGANRKVLERIKETGDIFWAQSDRDWILDGAAVNVSMVGFDDKSELHKELDNRIVASINSDLSSTQSNSTQAQHLSSNYGLCFQGPVKVGAFDISDNLAQTMLASPNPNRKNNRDVIKPWMNGSDITGRSRNMWIIDFGEMEMEQASNYVIPFEYVNKNIKPLRDENADLQRKTYWWRLGRSGGDLKLATKSLTRLLITPRVSKYRLFIWASNQLLPDSAVVAIARDDDYFFGVLHSKIHEVWALKQGTSLEDRPRYTPTTTFETFPFPWPPSQEPKDDPRVIAIAQAAKQLDDFRNEWLNPPTDQIGPKALSKRTLTNLYNALMLYREEYKGKMRMPETFKEAVNSIIGLDEIETLDHIHTSLDHAVLDAYGWPHNLTDEQILEKLLALNLERAKKQ